jgi:hypothetical protein
MIFPSEALLETRSRLMEEVEGGTLSAELAYQTLLEADPQDMVALMGMGHLRHDAGDLTGSGGYFWRAVEAQPCYWLGYMELAHVEDRRGQTALSHGLSELGLRKLRLDPESLEEIAEDPDSIANLKLEGFEDLHGDERLEALAEMFRERRDLEPAEVTARLRPFRLLQQIQEAEELDSELIDVVLGEGEAITPLLAGILRGYAQSPLFGDDDWVVENALALLGEIGSPAILPSLLEFCTLDNDNLSGAAGWAIDRIIELQPEGAATALLALAPRLDLQARLAVTGRMLGWPDWPFQGKLLERLTENAESLPEDDRSVLFPVLLTTMIATRGEAGMDMARATLRSNAGLMDLNTRRECTELIEAAGEFAGASAHGLERPSWTVYQICAGEAVWPVAVDEENEEDDE